MITIHGMFITGTNYNWDMMKGASHFSVLTHFVVKINKINDEYNQLWWHIHSRWLFSIIVITILTQYFLVFVIHLHV